MRLIEPDELRQFAAALQRRSCALADFELREIDTTDPKSDELLPMKGYVGIRRKANGAVREYPIGDGTSWVAEFERDLAGGHYD
jgi:hypothetical protein